MTRLPVLRTIALLPLLGELAMAQTNDPRPSARVRVTAPSFSDKRLVGVLESLDETTLTLKRGGSNGPLRVPRAAITKIEASRQRSQRLSGAVIGMLIGSGAAAVIGYSSGDDCSVRVGPENRRTVAPGGLYCLDRREMAVLSGIFIVPATTLLFAAASPGEKWEAVTTDRLQIAVAPARGGGMRASLALRF